MKKNYMFVGNPEDTSIFGATAFYENTCKIFDHLTKIVEEHSFTVNNIYDADKTGVRNLYNPDKVVDLLVQKQVIAAELGELVTLVCAINASDKSILPMFILPRKRFYNDFTSGLLVMPFVLF